MPKFITLTQLEAAGACLRERKRFEALFGPRVRVTEELAKVVASEFSWLWAAEHLLSEEGQRIFEEAKAPARDVFYRTRLALNSALAVAFAKAYVADD